MMYKPTSNHGFRLLFMKILWLIVVGINNESMLKEQGENLARETERMRRREYMFQWLFIFKLQCTGSQCCISMECQSWHTVWEAKLRGM